MGPRLIMLLAATSAPKTALSRLLLRHELVLVEHMRGARHVAGDEDVVGHHAVDVERAAARVAGHTPEPARQLRAAVEPFHVEDRAQRGHHHVDVEHGAVGEASRADVTVTVTVEAVHRHAGAQVDPGLDLHLRGDVADHTAERADQRRLAALGDRHRKVEVATHRGDLQSDETRADDEHPAWSLLERGGQLRGVVTRAHGEQPLQGGLLRVEPRARPGSGGDQQPVVVQLLAVGQQNLAVGPVQAHRRHAEAPVRIDGTQAGELGVTPSSPACVPVDADSRLAAAVGCRTCITARFCWPTREAGLRPAADRHRGTGPALAEPGGGRAGGRAGPAHPRGRGRLQQMIAARPRRVLVIGAGFTGSEIASACRMLDLPVTVAEAGPAPLGGGARRVIGAIAADVQRENGVDLRCGVMVTALEGDAEATCAAPTFPTAPPSMWTWRSPRSAGSATSTGWRTPGWHAASGGWPATPAAAPSTPTAWSPTTSSSPATWRAPRTCSTTSSCRLSTGATRSPRRGRRPQHDQPGSDSELFSG